MAISALTHATLSNTRGGHPIRPTVYCHHWWGNNSPHDRNLVDGTPCPFCGKPLHKSPAQNFDGAALEADLTGDIKHHGQNPADRLLHRTCNRSRGDGHDERSPLQETATTRESTPAGPTGWDWLG